MTWWSWFAYCELIGDWLYEVLLHLWRSSEDSALAMERGFDEEAQRLWSQFDEALR